MRTKCTIIIRDHSRRAPIEADALAPIILLSYPLVNDDAVGLMLRKSIRLKHGGGIMTVTALLITLAIGAIAGWLAGQLVQGTGYGLIGDIVVGIVGALIAGALFPRLGLGLTLGGGVIGAIVAATIGAVILLLIVRLVRQMTA
jgi:uncharacterized membrane protein YeaQ/YmgE (transglycosylase-associated protein family)